MHETSTSARASKSGAAKRVQGGKGQAAQEHQHHDGEGHVSIPRMAVKVFIALCVLTCASLLTYTTFWQEHVPMEIGRAVMLTVSLTKAFLVVAFFMHLWWESKWKYVVTFPALVVSALLCISLVPDIGMRTRQYDAARLVSAPEAMPYTVGRDLEVSQPVISPASEHSGDHSGEHATTPSQSSSAAEHGQ